MKKIISVVLSTVILLSVLVTVPITASASSYPWLFGYPVEASVGEKVPITMTYFPEFNYEELEFNLYDPDGEIVGNKVSEIDNRYESSIRYYTLSVDTEGYKPGKYELVITKRFYSYYSWHTAPTTDTVYMYLKDDLGNVKGNNEYTGSKESFSCVQNGYQKATTNTVFTARSAWKKTIFKNYNVVLSSLYTGDTANDIILEENFYNAPASYNSHWYLMKFTITNTGSSELKADSVISPFGMYKYTGNKMYVAETATLSDDYGRKGVRDVTIQPGTSEDVWLGIYVPINQQVPYILIDNTYLNINPLYANRANTSLKFIDSKNAATKKKVSLVKQNGTWYYTENGKKVKKTTLCKYNGSWYYVKNGKVDFNATTLCKYNDEWYYVRKGKVNFNTTTLFKYNDIWYYVKNGKVNFYETTLIKYNGAWYYVNDGKVTKDNTLIKYDGVWYHVKGGKTVKDTTLVKYNDTWYYVKNGRVDFNATTLCKYNNKWYYVQNGKVNFNANTNVKYNGKWYIVRNGVVV